MSPLLEVQSLSVDIPLTVGTLHAVRDVSFSVKRGETLYLVGESGCGKSLSALAVMDLLPPRAQRSADRLRFDDQDLYGIGSRAMADIRGHRMAMIFQEPLISLNPCYTIGNQLVEALRSHRKVTRAQARDRAVFLLEKIGITAAADRLSQYPHQLSGGLRQRVMIAMGLMCDPLLLIADEPTTALDVTIQAQILSQLAGLQEEFHMGLVLITHDLGVVARVADRVAVMYCGEVFETGAVTQIFEAPPPPYTQGLMKCIPIPGKTRPGDHLGAIPGIVPTPIGQLLHGCTFRNRCPNAFDHCAAVNVEMVTVGPGHGYRCLLRPEETRRRAKERAAS